MENPTATAIKESESQKQSSQQEIPVKTSNIPRLSSFNFSTTRSRSVNSKTDGSGMKKKEKLTEISKNKSEAKKEINKPNDEKKGFETQTCIPVRDRGRRSDLFRGKILDKKRKNHHYQKFKSKFNISAGKILKDWMSLIYCILVLRMHLIKFVLEQLPHCGITEINFQKQILNESKSVYETIKHAQNYSHEQFLHIWNELERLIFSYIMLKNSLVNKKQLLVKLQNDINELKNSQNETMKNYVEKIEALKNQIEEKVEEIRVEKEEKTKIKSYLEEWLEDFSEKE